MKRCIKVEEDEWEMNGSKGVKNGEADLRNPIVEIDF